MFVISGHQNGVGFEIREFRMTVPSSETELVPWASSGLLSTDDPTDVVESCKP